MHCLPALQKGGEAEALGLSLAELVELLRDAGLTLEIKVFEETGA